MVGKFDLVDFSCPRNAPCEEGCGNQSEPSSQREHGIIYGVEISLVLKVFASRMKSEVLLETAEIFEIT